MGCGASTKGHDEKDVTARLSLGEALVIKKTPVKDAYENVSKLGAGSFGSVSQVKNKKTQEVRALKQITKRSSERGMIADEISAHSCVDHMHIVKLYEVFEDAKNYYLVMEMCEGGELFDAILHASNRHFSEKHAARIMKQIMMGVTYMHAQFVCHRDIKAENFLLLNKTANLDQATIKIVDFGLATKFQRGVPMDLCAGTPTYVAPEVLNRTYDERVDVWSCGVLLYIMLCGLAPFKGTSDKATLTLVSKGNVKFKAKVWKHITDQAKDLIKNKMIVLDPKQRCSAANVLHDTWLKELAPRASDTILREEQIDNLKNFCGQNKLFKATLQTVARRLQEKDIRHLKDMFISLDKNGSAVAAILEQIMSEIDCDKNYRIAYTEFLAATLSVKMYEEQDVLWSAFCAFDKDGSKTISLKELQLVLQDDNVKDHFGVSASERLMKEVDTDGDGQINFDEFVAMMRNRDGPVPSLQEDETGDKHRLLNLEHIAGDIDPNEIGTIASEMEDRPSSRSVVHKASATTASPVVEKLESPPVTLE